MGQKEQLFDKIQFHNQKYWIENNPQISDEEYDTLVNKYLSLGGKYEDLKLLQTNLLNGKKYIHKVPMLSLDKAYTPYEVSTWAEKIKRTNNEVFLIQPKFDGWACKYLQKENRIITRGDGHEGEDISSKLPLINFKIHKDHINLSEVIGEIVIDINNFEKYQHLLTRKNGQPYKTPRTCLTGLLASDDIKQLPEPILDFVDYSLYSQEMDFELLINYDWTGLIDFFKNRFNYPCDGIVIKLKDINYFNSLGSTAHHPYGAIAFKFGNPTGTTKLKGIEWFVGKGNTINPVAILEPVKIAGHTISRVNLHNAENILNLNIKINDTVVVQRCGEIIPDIVKVIPGENRKDIIIEKCPSCGAALSYDPPFLYCNNNMCSGSIIKNLTDSCARLDIKNIGEGTVEKIVNGLGIYYINDLLKLTINDILCLPGYAELSAKNLYNEIQKIINEPIEDWKILACLNIRGIGLDISKTILKYFTLEELLDNNISTYEKLLEIPGLSNVRIGDLDDGLNLNKVILEDLLKIFKNIKVTKGCSNPNLPKICFTGKMPQTRSYYEDLAKKKGYEPVSVVNKDLSLLVTTEIDRKSSKMDKAKKLGIKIITLNQFIGL